MQIKWNEPPYDGGFVVLHYSIYVNNALYDGNIIPTQKTYVLTGLTLGSSYKLQVSSTNEIGESALSEANTVLFANVPSSPATLTLATQMISKEEPHIVSTWTAPSSMNGDVVSGYKLYIDDGRGGDYVLAYDGSGFANVYTFTIVRRVTCGVVYNVKITAINIAGESTPTLQ
jgi:hypothetical protein